MRETRINVRTHSVMEKAFVVIKRVVFRAEQTGSHSSFRDSVVVGLRMNRKPNQVEEPEKRYATHNNTGLSSVAQERSA